MTFYSLDTFQRSTQRQGVRGHLDVFFPRRIDWPLEPGGGGGDAASNKVSLR